MLRSHAPAYDAHFFTSDAAVLGRELSRDASHVSAFQAASASQAIEPRPAHAEELSHGFGIGM
jgi:hypothetical protein